MRRILFVNENALGHSSYLPAFAREIESNPACGFAVDMLQVAPLPEEYERQANRGFPGAPYLGFSQHFRRWREAASRYAAELTSAALAKESYAAVVVNTQSVALDLPAALPPNLPLFVCLDATFEQLRLTPWFAKNALSRALQPLTLGNLLQQERALFARATKVLPWSAPVAASLTSGYSISQSRIDILPPSLPLSSEIFQARQDRNPGALPQILFLGGDFRRKGGPLVLDCFREHFRGKAQLHIVTQSEIPGEEGVSVWRGVKAYSKEWLDLWRAADVFVFPSHLETFGIVLLEAQAFGVPVISSHAGAATDLLQEGNAGWLLSEHSVASLERALSEVLANPGEARQRAERARDRLRRDFDLSTNTKRLLALIPS